MSRHRSTTDAERVRDSVLDDAVRAGKIAAASRDEYGRMYDADPVAIRRLLTARVEEGGLMPGLRGAGEDPATAAPGGYDPSWLSPIERERISAANRPHPAPSPAPYTPPGPAPGVPPSPTPKAPRPQPKQAAQGAGPAASGEYPSEWLAPDERERIEATREGRYTPDRVQFDEGVRPR